MDQLNHGTISIIFDLIAHISAKISDLKSKIKYEQLKNKHLFDRSTERLAELEELRKKLRNNDAVI